jgi:nicotinamide riboside kinase
MNKTTIINLYGGPSAGKSTSAAYLYFLLKITGFNVELVREYVKEWIWDERKFSQYDQVYFLGKQIRRESLLLNKVEFIVTDAPVMMNLMYAEKYCGKFISAGVREATINYYEQAKEDKFNHVHILLNRSKPYQSEGRFQSEKEAIEIDTEVHSMFNK